MNKIILMGRLTADAELKATSSNKKFCTFTIAQGDGFGENKHTNFIKCIAWNKTAEFITEWFGKGKMIAVVGKLQTRSWETDTGEKRYATEVIVSETYFCGGKNDETVQKSLDNVDFLPVEDDNDDVPF